MNDLETFSSHQVGRVTRAVSMSEELVSNAYKMSASQWLRRKYDVKTLSELAPHEIVHGPFAQIIRYEGQKKDSLLGSSAYDFYKICLQDHAILRTVCGMQDIRLFPFMLYILIHELIHIVRFSTFIQQFDAESDEMMNEERRVHQKTHDILRNIQVPDLPAVLNFFEKWRMPLDGLKDS